MRGLVVTSNEKSVAVDLDMALPEPEAHEVLLEVKACAVSPPSSHILAQRLSATPLTPGSEVSGIVAALGRDVPTSAIAVGDEVCAVLPMDADHGGFAEYCCVDYLNCVQKPACLSFPIAAASIAGALTSYTALHYHARIQAGETILIIDGAATANYLCTLMALRWGANVLVTCRNDEQGDFLRKLDPRPTRIIGPYPCSLVEAVLEETGGMGVDCIVDSGDLTMNWNPSEATDPDSSDTSSPEFTGVPLKRDLVALLAPGGRWVTASSSLQLDPPESTTLFLKGASLGFLFPNAWLLSSVRHGKYLHIITHMLKLLSEESALVLEVAAVDINGVPLALQDVREHSRTGAVVLSFE